MMKTILILEDNAERIAAFESAVASLKADWSIKLWRDAPSMIAECAEFLPTTRLISLDHDLNPQPGTTEDPGTGVDVASYLALFPPVCPVILHSSNHERVYSMYNELRFAGWRAERVGPMGDDWIGKAWVRQAKVFLAEQAPGFENRRPADHLARVERALLSLHGLAMGDALGEMLAYRAETAPRMLGGHELPAGPWFHTDDTEMALSLFEVLKVHGFVQSESLARRFARRFARDPDRGYGKMTRIQLREVLAGAKWRDMARGAFGGQGSMGNGGAMRVPPLGAYFADEPEKAAREAAVSSEVTHTHPEGIAGTVAAAVAASLACQAQGQSPREFARRMFTAVLDLVAESKVRRGIEQAADVSLEADPVAVGLTLGNGFLVTAPDTVPFALWCAARHINAYPQALTAAICSGGDCDTNAAIVGGIVACAVGREGIPDEWYEQMEPLTFI